MKSETDAELKAKESDIMRRVQRLANAWNDSDLGLYASWYLQEGPSPELLAMTANMLEDLMSDLLIEYEEVKSLRKDIGEYLKLAKPLAKSGKAD